MSLRTGMGVLYIYWYCCTQLNDFITDRNLSRNLGTYVPARFRKPWRHKSMSESGRDKLVTHEPYTLTYMELFSNILGRRTLILLRTSNLSSLMDAIFYWLLDWIWSADLLKHSSFSRLNSLSSFTFLWNFSLTVEWASMYKGGSTLWTSTWGGGGEGRGRGF